MDSVVDCPETVTDERTNPVYTRVNYLYRDADNYKQFGSALLYGTISDEQKCIIAATLDDGDGHFIPDQIGWEHPGRNMSTWPSSSDHCWAEIDMEDATTFEVIDDTTSRAGEIIHGTVDAWVKQMLEAKSIGWDDARYGVNV
jgi:hypothetical protein